MNQPSPTKSKSIAIGLLLIVLGIIFLGHSFDVIRLGHLINHWWPLILIAIGICKLGRRDRNNGILMILLGTLFLLSTLNIIHWHQIWRFWPIILIIIGIGMLIKRFPSQNDDSTDFSSQSAEDKIEINSLFCHTNRKLTSRQLRAVELNAVFGSLTLDLRQAVIATEGCILTTDAIFGTIDIYVPLRCSVNFQVSQFLGRAENRVSGTSNGPTITIKGNAIFGNIRVSN
jgi:predicted membrane protein